MKYFFYGTLRESLVREVVLRRRVPAAAVHAARLAGYACVYRRHATYPVLVASRAAVTEGTLVAGLGIRDARLLADYEGPDYRVATLSVVVAAGRRETAQVFLPADPGIATPQPWSLQVWRRRHRAGFVARLQRYQRRSWAADRTPAPTGDGLDPPGA